VKEADMAAPRNEYSYALIDINGVITAVNETWRALAKATGLTLPRFGIGASYLSHCADEEQRSSIRSVASGETKLVSFIYPCHTPEQKRWFVAVGLPLSGSACGAAVMHIDVSNWTPAHMISGSVRSKSAGFDARALETAALHQSVAEALARSRQIEREDPINRLSPRQMEVLKLIAKGRSNLEIAQELGCQITTVKQHVSAILERLGLPSRTKAALYWKDR
jgi:DNA-binding CsgD family transcriptional regulator